MKNAIRYTGFGACFAICILLAGCGNAGQEKIEISDVAEASAQEALSESEADAQEALPESETAAQEVLPEPKTTAQDGKENDFAGLSPEQIDAYRQLTLYIQEGFHTYGIEGMYEAYFGEIQDDDGKYECEILLEGEGELWSETISYTYDEQSGWYSFEGQGEYIFAKDSSLALREDHYFVEEMRENYVYQTQIAKNLDIGVSVHYNSESGPIEHDKRMMLPNSEWMGTYVNYHYTYYDDRMDIDITIEYPQVWLEDKELQKRINAALREAFFYAGRIEEKEWNPSGEAYAAIDRNYVITREDETYFSMRIYEYAYARGNAHPHEGETGITINMLTGEVLQLRDVVGDDRTLVSLLDTGAFQCLWFWENDKNGESWLKDMREKWEDYDSDLLDKMNSYFYLTQDGLGLITSDGRYYTPIEAKFEDLGVEFGTGK